MSDVSRRAATRLHRAAAAVDREAAGWKDLDTHIDDVRALRAIGLAVCGRNNLIPSDFADISAVEMEREFDQGVHGVRITFTVSNHALDEFAGGVGRDQRSCRAAERAGRGRRAVGCERVRKASAMAP